MNEEEFIDEKITTNIVNSNIAKAHNLSHYQLICEEMEESLVLSHMNFLTYETLSNHESNYEFVPNFEVYDSYLGQEEWKPLVRKSRKFRSRFSRKFHECVFHFVPDPRISSLRRYILEDIVIEVIRILVYALKIRKDLYSIDTFRGGLMKIRDDGSRYDVDAVLLRFLKMIVYKFPHVFVECEKDLYSLKGTRCLIYDDVITRLLKQAKARKRKLNMFMAFRDHPFLNMEKNYLFKVISMDVFQYSVCSYFDILYDIPKLLRVCSKFKHVGDLIMKEKRLKNVVTGFTQLRRNFRAKERNPVKRKWDTLAEMQVSDEFLVKCFKNKVLDEFDGIQFFFHSFIKKEAVEKRDLYKTLFVHKKYPKTLAFICKESKLEEGNFKIIYDCYIEYFVWCDPKVYGKFVKMLLDNYSKLFEATEFRDLNNIISKLLMGSRSYQPVGDEKREKWDLYYLSLFSEYELDLERVWVSGNRVFNPVSIMRVVRDPRGLIKLIKNKRTQVIFRIPHFLEMNEIFLNINVTLLNKLLDEAEKRFEVDAYYNNDYGGKIMKVFKTYYNLLKLLYNPCAYDRSGRTILSCCCQNGFLKVVEYLVNGLSVPIHDNEAKMNSFSSIEACIKFGRPQILRLLLKTLRFRKGKNVAKKMMKKNGEGFFTLYRESLGSEKEKYCNDIIKILIDEGMVFNERDFEKMISCDVVEPVRAIIERRGDAFIDKDLSKFFEQSKSSNMVQMFLSNFPDRIRDDIRDERYTIDKILTKEREKILFCQNMSICTINVTGKSKSSQYCTFYICETCESDYRYQSAVCVACKEICHKYHKLLHTKRKGRCDCETISHPKKCKCTTIKNNHNEKLE